MAWRGVVVQIALIVALLTITVLCLVRNVDGGILHLLVGSFCTAFGTVVARARLDGGSSGGDGSGLTMRAPPPPRLPTSDGPRSSARVVAAQSVALAFVVSVAVLLGVSR